MKTKTATAKTAQGVDTGKQDLFAMFQQFMAQQGAQAQAPAAVTPTASPKAPKAPRKAAKTGKLTGVRIHEINGGKSFFVYGDGATVALAELFTRKPHLNRGLKERDITGVGKVAAYWFGGRQIERVKKALKLA